MPLVFLLLLKDSLLSVTSSPAIARITDLTDCLPSHLTGVWHFLSVINNSFGCISHRFRGMASFPLKNAHLFYSFSIQPKNFKMLPLH